MSKDCTLLQAALCVDTALQVPQSVAMSFLAA